jgi:hypothetical protein
MALDEWHTKTAADWLKKHFEAQIREQVYGTPWTVKLVCAIFCQETAYKVLRWINDYEPLTILQRCVFDASGDFPGTTRFAFPKNKTEFQNKYGETLTQKLIDEGNKQRRMPQWDAPTGYSDADYLYKAYGLFCYDLQNIIKDPDFFVFKKWYNMSDCLQKLVEELNEKANTHGNLRSIVKAYNGSGAAADEYAGNVMKYMEILQS